MTRRALPFLVLLFAGTGCPSRPVPDAGTLDPAYRALPPLAEVPASLDAAAWKRHWEEDIKPYWVMPQALGSPAGNYPTFRTMTGMTTGRTDRYTRMIGRQVYVYAMGYALTGDPQLLQHAAAGVDWLLTRARDPRGGFHPVLDGNGAPKGELDKYSQDLSYALLGLSAWWFVTRDPRAEAELLAGRDLLFDPATFYDAVNGRIRDGMNAALTQEVDQSSDSGGWELVAQLDVVNAFLLLTQPTLSEPWRRAQFLDDLERLGTTMLDSFWAEEEALFWGTTTQKAYGRRHVDFGHTLKTWWMLLSIDKRLLQHPFHERVWRHGPATLDRAWDPDNERWAKAPTGADTVQYGNDWWIAAEENQFAASLALLDRSQVDRLARVAAHWESDWVDDRGIELIPAIRRDGSPVFAWPDGDTAKSNEWKNGFHSTEHAVVMYIVGRSLAGAPVELHFAVPADQVQSFIAVPYVYEGVVSGRAAGPVVNVGGRALTDVTVSFTGVY